MAPESPKMGKGYTGGLAVRQSAVMFKAKGLNFEGVVATPEGVEGPFPGVVICHPHPLFGGNMDNNVVLSVAYALVCHPAVQLPGGGQQRGRAHQG